MEQLPGQLKSNESLAGTGSQRQQNAVAAFGQRGQHALDGDVLIVAPLEIAALVLERNAGKTIAPGIFRGEGGLPQRFRAGEGRQLALDAGMHVDAVDALAVRRIGEADRQLARVILGLADAFGQCLFIRLGLDDGQLGIPVFQNVVGG